MDMESSKTQPQSFTKWNDHVTARLGYYVYVLKDPRNSEVFYVGKGQGNRIFSHLEEAAGVLAKPVDYENTVSKCRRIIDIWLDGYEVELAIAARGLRDEEEAHKIEAAIYDSLTWAERFVITNQVSPPEGTFLSYQDFDTLLVEPVNPKQAARVFICNISQTYPARDAYNATRGDWVRKPAFAETTVGVGLFHGVSKGAYSIASWNIAPTNYPSIRDQFTSPGAPDTPQVETEFHNKDWSKVINTVRGYWQWGNPVVIEFDGNGKFRVILGAADKKTWHSCI